MKYSRSSHESTPSGYKNCLKLDLAAYRSVKTVWGLGKIGFHEGVHKQSCPLMRVSVRRVSTVQDFQMNKTKSFKGFLWE